MQVERGRVVTPEEIIDDGVLAIVDGVISHVGPWGRAPQEVRDSGAAPRPGTYLLPGLVDIHNHGGGGVSFPDAHDLTEIRRGVEEHRRFGTARMLASLVTAPAQVLRERVTTLADAVDAGLLAGIHLEGPFIATARRGAQNPVHIIDGDASLTAELIELGRGHIRTMTLAPETPNVREVIRVLVEGGVLPSFGHTDASDRVTRETIDFTVDLLRGSGRRATVTHLFNGMRPIHHREPGPIPPLLAAARRGDLLVELIGDGTHLDPGMVLEVFNLVGADNLALVTDAMAATGMADGDYRLGTLDIIVEDGVARLARGDSIAGGTAHLLDVVRTTVSGGVGLLDAVRSASTIPATVIDPDADFGALRAGLAGDFIRVDEDMRIING